MAKLENDQRSLVPAVTNCSSKYEETHDLTMEVSSQTTLFSEWIHLQVEVPSGLYQSNHQQAKTDVLLQDTHDI